MSIVRYKNKKTGLVSIYESTSNYDPINKTSRPKRKYLGTEDPVTHELIPSSGKRGRKPKSTTTAKSVPIGAAVASKPEEPAAATPAPDALLKECVDLKAENRRLQDENLALRKALEVIQALADNAISSGK
jgi:hypothetical protein